MDFAPVIALELALYAYKAALLTNQPDEVIRERLEAFRATVEDAIAQYPETSEKSDTVSASQVLHPSKIYDIIDT